MSTTLATLITPLRRMMSTQAWRSFIPEGKALIGGQWRSGTSGQTFPVFNPATGEHITDVPCASSSEDLQDSIKAAAEAQPAWAALTVGNRAGVLERWASALERNAPTIAQLITAENVCQLRIRAALLIHNI